MAALIGYGAYVPYNRLVRAKISAALGGATAIGTRAVASYDEDSTSMAVEAGRIAMGSLGENAAPQRLLFATANPPYLDKTNANVIHAALSLDPRALALDVMGSVRSGVGALLLASESTESTMAVLADIRTGLPGGADERDGGDGAAAFIFGDGVPGIATLLGQASTTDEFLDRWRLPGSPASRVWEERFGEQTYLPLADAAFAEALKAADLTPGDVDLLVVAGTHDRAVRAFAGGSGVTNVAPELSASVGNTGTAHPGLMLANALDSARPNQTIVLVVLADGATALILRTTDHIDSFRRGSSVAHQIDGGDTSLSYADFLTWRGMLQREPPRRPDPAGPAAPPSHRSERYKYGFVGSRCIAPTPAGAECSTINIPPARVCFQCKALDQMVPQPMADVAGTVATYTIDWLAYSLSPPIVAVVIDFDGGGRFSCELTDADPTTVAIGDRVEMTFRRILTAQGVHNYFWKAKPFRSAGAPVPPDTTIHNDRELQP